MNTMTIDARPVQQMPAELFETESPRGPFAQWVHQHPAIALGGGLLFLMSCIAVMAPWITSYDPGQMTPMLRGRKPSWEHLFGTDMLGRDVFARVIYGARISLTVGFAVAVMATVIGVAVGIVSGFFRVADAIIMRITDGLMSIPPILLAIALTAISRPSVTNVIIAITIAEMPRMSRLVRGVVLSLRERPYVMAAQAAGTPLPKIIMRHILPNTLAPIMVQATYICAAAMITEAILSFIGAGAPTSIPSWGNIISEARAVWQLRPYLVFIPAIFLSLTVLAVNMLGDGLRDALDPRMAKRV